MSELICRPIHAQATLRSWYFSNLLLENCPLKVHIGSIKLSNERERKDHTIWPEFAVVRGPLGWDASTPKQSRIYSRYELADLENENKIRRTMGIALRGSGFSPFERPIVYHSSKLIKHLSLSKYLVFVSFFFASSFRSIEISFRFPVSKMARCLFS